MNLTNQEIAQRLRRQATELARARNNLYRVRAFRQAAMAILALPEEVSTIVRQSGIGSLETLPGVGKSLAVTISEYLITAREVGRATVAA